MWAESVARLYVEPVGELSAEVSERARAELAAELTRGVEQAVEVTAERSWGKSVSEVSARLREELRWRGIDVEGIGELAEEIVDAWADQPNPSRP